MLRREDATSCGKEQRKRARRRFNMARAGGMTLLARQGLWTRMTTGSLVSWRIPSPITASPALFSEGASVLADPSTPPPRVSSFICLPVPSLCTTATATVAFTCSHELYLAATSAISTPSTTTPPHTYDLRSRFHSHRASELATRPQLALL